MSSDLKNHVKKTYECLKCEDIVDDYQRMQHALYVHPININHRDYDKIFEHYCDILFVEKYVCKICKKLFTNYNDCLKHVETCGN